MFRYSITKYLQNQTTKQIADDGSAFFLTFLKKKMHWQRKTTEKMRWKKLHQRGKEKGSIMFGPNSPAPNGRTVH